MPKKKPPDEESKQEEDFPEARSAADFLPEKLDLKNLREAAQDCRGCDLYKDATQVVFGEGNPKARIMFIGEQPGDAEDKQGHPFVGPAGKLLHRALESAGVDEEQSYFTNAVKHFKYEWRGKRRLHARPRRIEVLACMPWLQAEIAQLKPQVIVCLGATAAQALFGTKFKLTQHRGQFLDTTLANYVLATVHPSSILRAPDDETRHEEMQKFIDDLKLVVKTLKRS
jgi:uracil-DNA glycosylase